MARYVSGASKARRAAYRKSDAGRLARKFYLMRPEVKFKMALRRRVKRHMAGKG